jgi:mono/diheme cytochrome c family protein
MTRLMIASTTVAAVLYAAATLSGTDQVGRRDTPQLGIKSTYGADLYQFYCASCHGTTGRGAIVHSDQHAPPPDLTILSLNNGGVFPRGRVRATITNGNGASSIRAHGTADMPVWGAIFRGLEPSDTMVAIRIENLVSYLEQLQQAPGGPDRH